MDGATLVSVNDDSENNFITEWLQQFRKARSVAKSRAHVTLVVTEINEILAGGTEFNDVNHWKDDDDDDDEYNNTKN